MVPALGIQVIDTEFGPIQEPPCTTASDFDVQLFVDLDRKDDAVVKEPVCDALNNVHDRRRRSSQVEPRSLSSACPTVAR